MGLSFQKLPVTVTGFLLSLRHVMLGIPSVRVPHSQRNIFAANKGSLSAVWNSERTAASLRQ